MIASGDYLAGTIWPPIVEHFIRTAGWRPTYAGIGTIYWAVPPHPCHVAVL